MGIDIGTFSGNAKDGIIININLFAVSGTIRLFMKNGNELWGHIHLTPIIGPVLDEEFLIIEFWVWFMVDNIEPCSPNGQLH